MNATRYLPSPSTGIVQKRNRILGEMYTAKLDLELALSIDNPWLAVLKAEEWLRLDRQLAGETTSASSPKSQVVTQYAAIPSLPPSPVILAPAPRRNRKVNLGLLDPHVSPPLVQNSRPRIRRPATPWPRAANSASQVLYYYSSDSEGSNNGSPAVDTAKSPVHKWESEESSPVSELVENARVMRFFAVNGSKKNKNKTDDKEATRAAACGRRGLDPSRLLPPSPPDSNSSLSQTLQRRTLGVSAALSSLPSTPQSSYSEFWRHHDLSPSTRRKFRSEAVITVSPPTSSALAFATSPWPENNPLSRSYSRSASCYRSLKEGGSLSSDDYPSDCSSSSSTSCVTPLPASGSPCSIKKDIRKFDPELQFRWDVFEEQENDVVHGDGDDDGSEMHSENAVMENKVTCPYSTLCDCYGDARSCLVMAL